MENAYSLQRRWFWAIAALAVGTVIAGFWNYHVADGFGREIVAGRTIGDTGQLAHSFAANGFGFGLLFASIAGLAATFTACNCVVFAMIPGLACSNKRSSGEAVLRTLLVFIAGVIVICAAYGIVIGSLGGERIQAFNARDVRLLQAQITFSIIGLVMLVWSGIAFGFMNRWLKRFSPAARAFFTKANTKAGIMGIFVGFFAIGRPFPVFRDFLTYAAESRNPLYGAAVMAVQGLGQIAVMVALFLIIL